MLTHLPKPVTARPRAQLLGRDLDDALMGRGGEGGQPHRLAAVLGPNVAVAFALLLSAVLVGLATIALN